MFKKTALFWNEGFPNPCSCGGGCLCSSWLLWVGSAAVRNCHLILTFWLIRKSPAWMALCGWPWGEICAPWSLATRAKHILPGEYLCRKYLDSQFFILYPDGSVLHSSIDVFSLQSMTCCTLRNAAGSADQAYWCLWKELFHKKVYSFDEQN